LRSLRRFVWLPVRREDLAPLLAIGALVLLIAVQLAIPSRTPLPADPGLAPRRARPPAAAQLPAYPDIVKSGLFSPDRSGGNSSAASAPGSDGWSAVGVVSVGRASAGLVKPGPGPVVMVRVGETLEGWRLVAAKGDALVFERQDERRKLPLGAAAAPAPQAQGGQP
jgi:hypothetical protein